MFCLFLIIVLALLCEEGDKIVNDEQKLLEELALYKIRSKKTYQRIANEIGITPNVLKKFTAPSYDCSITYENKMKLKKYLEERKEEI